MICLSSEWGLSRKHSVLIGFDVNFAKEGGGDDPSSPAAAEQFEYIADMLKELRVMALGLDADGLAHIIEVAMLEALLQSEIGSGPPMRDT